MEAFEVGEMVSGCFEERKHGSGYYLLIIESRKILKLYFNTASNLGFKLSNTYSCLNDVMFPG